MLTARFFTTTKGPAFDPDFPQPDCIDDVNGLDVRTSKVVTDDASGLDTDDSWLDSSGDDDPPAGGTSTPPALPVITPPALLASFSSASSSALPGPTSSAIPRRVPHTWIEVTEDDGSLLGWICMRQTATLRSLDAHCNHHSVENSSDRQLLGDSKLDCKCDKKASAGKPGSGTGRPLGFLIAWLRVGGNPDCLLRDDHCGDGCRQGAGKFAHHLDFETRLAARKWAEAKPELRCLFDFERQELWPGEDVEPCRL
jgi:hypothetical protein